MFYSRVYRRVEIGTLALGKNVSALSLGPGAEEDLSAWVSFLFPFSLTTLHKYDLKWIK